MHARTEFAVVRRATFLRSKRGFKDWYGHLGYLQHYQCRRIMFVPVSSGDKDRYLKDWLDLAQITKGAVFRRLIGTGFPPKEPPRPGREPKLRTIPERIGARLSLAAVGNIFKSVAKHIKMAREDIRAISGHTIRVGVTQDLLALNIDLASVMQAGRPVTIKFAGRKK